MLLVVHMMMMFGARLQVLLHVAGAAPSPIGTAPSIPRLISLTPRGLWLLAGRDW